MGKHMDASTSQYLISRMGFGSSRSSRNTESYLLSLLVQEECVDTTSLLQAFEAKGIPPSF